MLLHDITPDCLKVSQDSGQWTPRTGVHIELTPDYGPVDIVRVTGIHIKSLQDENVEGRKKENIIKRKQRNLMCVCFINSLKIN